MHVKLKGDETIRPLCKTEIDRRIDALVSQIVSAAAASPIPEPLRPRWITAAELVRRLRPFLVYN